MTTIKTRGLLSIGIFFAATNGCSSSEPSRSASVDSDNQPGESDPSPPSNGDPTRKNDAPSGSPKEEGQGSGEPLFIGRFDRTDPAGPKAAWPGSRIIARFTGAELVTVKLSEFAEPWMEGAPSYWDVRIDHNLTQSIESIPDNQPHDFTIATNLPPGEHEVEIYKRSETQTGITQFLGFDFHGGRMLPPPPRPERRIEVMGDSQSTGFGIKMLNAPNHDCPGADHGGRWQDFGLAWGAVLGERFHAEVHGITYSGKGVIKNIWPTDTDPLVNYYGRANPNPAIQNNPPLFDLTSWIPDVIVLAQGAIDFSTGVDYGRFREGYRNFVVNTLRARGKNTHIFMSVLGRSGRDQIPQIGRELIAERAALGDDKLHVFVAKDYVWTEMVACNGHGTPDWHARIASELAAEISKATGWN